MDEPLSNLDAKLRNQMRVELTALHKQLGTTFIYVTHDQVEAMTMGDQIVVMDQGRIQQVASPFDLYQEPKNLFVAQFIGSPAMNILPSGREDLLVGFRPEKAKMYGKDKKVQPELTESGLVVQGKIMSREILGADVLYYVRTSNEQIIVKGDSDNLIDEGEDVRIIVVSKDLFFFDKQTGERVGDENGHRAENILLGGWS